MMDKQGRQEVISWMKLSYMINIMILLLQQVGLMHYMYMCQNWCIYLVLFDVICTIHWMLYASPKMVGYKGSSCWVLYSRTLTIKSFVIYFWILPSQSLSIGVLLQFVGGATIEIILLLLITPTLYTILAFSTGVHLYGGLNVISSERLMHTDMIIQVIFDMLDIIDIFHKFASDYDAFITNNFFYRIICGIFVATAIFLHGYTFPSMSGTSKANLTFSTNNDTNTANDIYFCRKYAAIVGICFINLPFLFIRLYAWQSATHYYGMFI